MTSRQRKSLVVAGIAALGICIAILRQPTQTSADLGASPKESTVRSARGDARPGEPGADSLEAVDDAIQRAAEALPTSPTSAEAVKPAVNRLTIEVNSANGDVPTGLKIGLSSGDGALFPDVHGDFSSLSERYDHTTWLGNSTDDQDHQLALFELPEKGVLNLRGIVVGSPLRVRVIAPLDIVVHDEQITALSDGEIRVVPVTLTLTAHQLGGTVRDERGNVRAGVKLQVRTDCLDSLGKDINGTLETHSDQVGRYRLAPLYVSRVHLTAAGTGLVAKRLEDVDLLQKRDFDLVLEAGAHVNLHVSDSAGRPVEVDSVWAIFGDGQLTSYARNAGGGEYEFTDLPHSQVVLSLNFGGKLYEQTHDALVSAATIVLPAQGQVEVSWILPVEFDQKNAYICLRRKSEEMPVLQQSIRELSGTFTFENVLPGVYEAGIERFGRGRAHTVLVEYEPALVQPATTLRITIRR